MDQNNQDQVDTANREEFSLETFNVSGEFDHIQVEFDDLGGDSISDGGRRC
jgi:hypothetical protein